MSSTSGESPGKSTQTFTPLNDVNEQIEKLNLVISKMQYDHELEISKISNGYEQKLSEKEREISKICREHRSEMQKMETEYLKNGVKPITDAVEGILADRAILFKTKRGMILFGIITLVIIALIVAVILLVWYIKTKGI